MSSRLDPGSTPREPAIFPSGRDCESIDTLHSRSMHDGTDSHSPPTEGIVVRKRRKGIYILPNLFTLAALFGGFYAIVRPT